jgi:hypothetical protein
MKRHRSSSSPSRGKTDEAGASRAKVARDFRGPKVLPTAATSTTNEATLLNSSNNNNNDINFLSKNALYTPLSAYEQTKVEPSLYLGTKPSIPNSLQETSLVNFLRTVSLEYHYQPSSSSVVDPLTISTTTTTNPFLPPYLAHRNDCKYVGGSQPVSLSKMEERIRQRTVTLLGGGIHVTAAQRKATALKLLETNYHSRRQQNRLGGGLGRRRRQQRHERQRQRQLLHRQKLTSDNGNTTTTLHDLSSNDNSPLGEPREYSPNDHPSSHPHPTHHQLDFIRDLNTAWNDYIIQALSALEGTTVIARNTKKEGNDKDNDDNSIAFWRTLAHQFFAASSSLSFSSSLEWVGAHVQVLTCAQRLSLVHQKGVIVGQTQNTWTIAMVVPAPTRKIPRQRPNTKKTIEPKDEESYLCNTNTEGARNKTIMDLETYNDTRSPAILPTKQQEEEQQQQKNQHTWTLQSVMIPKRGTSIGLLLRIPCTNSPNNSLDPHSTTTLMATRIPMLIPNSPSPTLCIVVQPTTTHSVASLKR